VKIVRGFLVLAPLLIASSIANAQSPISSGKRDWRLLWLHPETAAYIDAGSLSRKGTGARSEVLMVHRLPRRNEGPQFDQKLLTIQANCQTRRFRVTDYYSQLGTEVSPPAIVRYPEEGPPDPETTTAMTIDVICGVQDLREVKFLNPYEAARRTFNEIGQR
jgi:hypothetical protein